MNKLLLTVLRCKESKQTIEGEEKTFYYLKFSNTTKDELFGKSVTQHLFMKSNVEFKEKQIVELPLDAYRIEEHDSKWADETTGEIIETKLKWIHLRSDVQKAMAL